MIQVGKKYEVIEPISAVNLGFSRYVKILKEESGMFLGDNEIWYSSNGRHNIADPLGAADTLHLALEVKE